MKVSEIYGDRKPLGLGNFLRSSNGSVYVLARVSNNTVAPDKVMAINLDRGFRYRDAAEMSTNSELLSQSDARAVLGSLDQWERITPEEAGEFVKGLKGGR